MHVITGQRLALIVAVVDGEIKHHSGIFLVWCHGAVNKILPWSGVNISN